MATVTRDRYVVERQDAGDWLLMTSDGAVRAFETAEAVYAFVRRRENRKVGDGARVSAIEWRHVPDGWTPPESERRD